MIKIILIIVAVFIVYCLIEMIRELRDFRVTKYRICSQKLNGIKREKKIIFLSDLSWKGNSFLTFSYGCVVLFTKDCYNKNDVGGTIDETI